jgi:alkylhydroperoxidase/carboxymuconolactone decarboxylase family protein YurZ
MSEQKTSPANGGMTGSDAETPVLDVLATMIAASLERSSLDPQTLMLVRLGALVAVGAPPVSYLLNLQVAGAAGVTAQQAQGVLAAVAPVVGGPRVVAAAGNIARALGIAIAVAEDELAAEMAADGAGRTS